MSERKRKTFRSSYACLSKYSVHDDCGSPKYGLEWRERRPSRREKPWLGPPFTTYRNIGRRSSGCASTKHSEVEGWVETESRVGRRRRLCNDTRRRGPHAGSGSPDLAWESSWDWKSNGEGAMTPEEGASAGSYGVPERHSRILPSPPPNPNGRQARRRRAAFYSSSIDSRSHHEQ